MPCPSCIATGVDLCESPVYRESAVSGWHIQKDVDLNGMTTSLCGLVFPAKTRSAVAPDSGLCSACLTTLHPEIKVAAKATECWDDD